MGFIWCHIKQKSLGGVRGMDPGAPVAGLQTPGAVRVQGMSQAQGVERPKNAKEDREILK